MAEEWLTYSDLGQRLGISPEAARQKAIRGHWPRRTANDGKTQVRVDVEDVRASTPVRKPKDEPSSDDRSSFEEHPSEARTFEALEDHIASLKAMVAKAEEIAVTERERANAEHTRADGEQARNFELTQRLAEVETARAALEGQATAMREILTSRDIEMTRERDRVALLSAKLVEATARATEAAGTETDLKNRLDGMAAELHALRSRPWWRLLG